MSVSSEARQLPVTIVGGYLGSGKTTLINHVLNNAQNRDCKFAILVNDFGELAIDAQLIESQDGDVINLSGGCVCCSYGNDLTGALMELDTQSIDQVVIESSGVALPGAIAGSLSLLSDYSVSAIVVVVDSSTVAQLSKDKYLADTIERQLSAADIIALNKTDLVSEAELVRTRQQIESAYPTARTINVSNADYPLDLFLIDSPAVGVDRLSDSAEQNIHQTSMYTSFVLNSQGRCDVQELVQALTDKSLGLLRVKGFVEDSEGTMQTVQIVGQRWSLQPAPDGVASGLVCIGLSAECNKESVRLLLQ